MGAILGCAFDVPSADGARACLFQQSGQHLCMSALFLPCQDAGTAPNPLSEPQRKLKQAQKMDRLSQHLHSRPSPDSLKQQRILLDASEVKRSTDAFTVWCVRGAGNLSPWSSFCSTARAFTNNRSSLDSWIMLIRNWVVFIPRCAGSQGDSSVVPAHSSNSREAASAESDCW